MLIFFEFIYLNYSFKLSEVFLVIFGIKKWRLIENGVILLEYKELNDKEIV